jgi:hypothetical protein
MTYSITRDNQLYVYVYGQLVYKRWLWRDCSVLFQVAPRFTYWMEER